MGLKNEEEESKANISDSETRWYPINPTIVFGGYRLADGAAGIAKMMNDNKAAQRQLEELKRHNRVMEGHGLYLAPYKSGQGVSTKKKRPRDIKNAEECYKRTFTYIYIQRTEIGKSYSIFSRYFHAYRTLPTEVRRNASGIVNLDNAEGLGTHWVAYEKGGIAQHISTVLTIFDCRRN